MSISKLKTSFFSLHGTRLSVTLAIGLVVLSLSCQDQATQEEYTAALQARDINARELRSTQRELAEATERLIRVMTEEYISERSGGRDISFEERDKIHREMSEILEDEKSDLHQEFKSRIDSLPLQQKVYELKSRYHRSVEDVERIEAARQAQ